MSTQHLHMTDDKFVLILKKIRENHSQCDFIAKSDTVDFTKFIQNVRETFFALLCVGTLWEFRKFTLIHCWQKFR